MRRVWDKRACEGGDKFIHSIASTQLSSVRPGLHQWRQSVRTPALISPWGPHPPCSEWSSWLRALISQTARNERWYSAATSRITDLRQLFAGDTSKLALCGAHRLWSGVAPGQLVKLAGRWKLASYSPYGVPEKCEGAYSSTTRCCARGSRPAAKSPCCSCPHAAQLQSAGARPPY